jgi:alkylhydroperoxidase family enzyme
MSWLPGIDETTDPLSGAFALRPNLAETWRDFTTLFWTRELVPAGLLELCRLRLARLHGAELPDLCPAMAAAREARLPAQAAAIDRWWESPAFDATERACLRFAEQFALDPKEITDDDAAAVVAALGEAGTVAFVEALAILDGFSRCARLFAPEAAR